MRSFVRSRILAESTHRLIAFVGKGYDFAKLKPVRGWKPRIIGAFTLRRDAGALTPVYQRHHQLDTVGRETYRRLYMHRSDLS